MRKTVLSMLLLAFFTVPLQAQLSGPSIVGPEDNHRTGTTPTLNWQDLDNATWYRIWINNKTQGTTHLKKWVKGSNTWTIPENSALNPDDTYRWWVAGWNSTDKLGSWSSAGEFKAGNVHYRTIIPGSRRETIVDPSGNSYLTQGTASNEYITHSMDVNLPHSSRIVEVKSYWEDNLSSQRNLTIKLKRTNEHGTVDTITDVSSSGGDGTSQTTVDDNPKNPIVDNRSFVLRLFVVFPGDVQEGELKLYRIRIKYIK